MTTPNKQPHPHILKFCSDDPDETVNLAANTEYAGIQQELHDTLRHLPAPWRNQHPDWRMKTVF